MYTFLFHRDLKRRLESVIAKGLKVKGLEGGDRVKPTLERCRRLNVEGFKEATERSVAQGRLHVTGADWRPPKTVTCYNSLDYSFDCVLYSWVGG
jgi:hypothetical protein